MRTERKADVISFDKGISEAEYRDVPFGQSKAKPEPSLLPGSTTVSEALMNIFPEGDSVSGEIMKALVAGNSAYLRTSAGFNETARETIHKLREKGGATSEAAVRELTALLADTELYEHYRASLLET